jgi:hypothetical protein
MTLKTWSAGEKAYAADVNDNFLQTYNRQSCALTAGETINGATLPVPVYFSVADSKVYACDGNVLAKLEFIGFAISNAINNGSITVQFSGIVSGFTGLTIGAYYFLSDTVGTIQATAGTYRMYLGKALSATTLLIVKPAYQTFASDSLRQSAATQRAITDAAYAKYKEVLYNDVGGVVRVKFTLDENTNHAMYGKIYKNGVAYGTERMATDVNQVYSEDLTFERGDLIQVYCYRDDPAGSGDIKDFHIYYDKILSPIIPTVNTD